MNAAGRRALILALLAVPGALVAQDPASEAEGLVREAWAAVDTTYYDPSFHGVDWAAVGDTFLSRPYATREEARGAIRRMLARLGNPSTRLLTSKQASELASEFAGRAHKGVGLLEVLSVDTDEETGEIVVVTPVPGGPAVRAGLRPGDVIVSVDGTSAEEAGLAATAGRLRGEPGTAVELVVRRDGARRRVRIVREAVPAVAPVEGSVREEGGLVVGYVGMRQFTPSSPEALTALLEELEAAGAEAWVLDLRNNPGGMVDALRDVAGAFLGEVPLVRMRDRSSDPVLLTGRGEARVEGPMVALVNRGTASAAEALAAALRNHGRAKLLGRRTFGKGLAHGLVSLSDGSALVVTVGRLETLDGRDVLTRGIEPDVPAPAPSSPVLDPGVPAGRAEDAGYRAAVEVLEDGSRVERD